MTSVSRQRIFNFGTRGDGGAPCSYHHAPEGEFAFACKVKGGSNRPAACYNYKWMMMGMELLDIKYGWLFSLELLLLVIANIPLANGQQGNTCTTDAYGQASLSN